MKAKDTILWMLNTGTIHKYNIAVSIEFFATVGELDNQDDITELYELLQLEEPKTLYELLQLTIIDYASEAILDKGFVLGMLDKFKFYNKITEEEYTYLVSQL